MNEKYTRIERIQWVLLQILIILDINLMLEEVEQTYYTGPKKKLIRVLMKEIKFY